MSDYAEEKAEIRQLVAMFFERSRVLQIIADDMARIGIVGYLFGGVVRDLVTAHGPNIRPRDYDIIIDCDNTEKYAELQKAMRARWTDERESPARAEEDIPFGADLVKGPLDVGSSPWSMRLVTEEGKVEIWSRLDHKMAGLKETIENVPKTTFLEIESVICTFGPRPGSLTLYDDGFISCMESRVLRCRPKIPQVNRQNYAAKSIVLCERLGLTPDATLASWIRHTFNIEDGPMAFRPEFTVREMMNKRYGDGTWESMPIDKYRPDRSLVQITPVATVTAA